VEAAVAQLQRARTDLERTKVKAPFDGRVRTKSVGLGQSVGPSVPLGEVFAVDFAEVRLPISSQQLQFLDLPIFADDPPVDVELRDALSETSTSVWHAKIVRTEGVLDENSREVFAIARVDDPFGKESRHRPLRIGQPVVASIKGKVLENVIALPRRAVRQLDQIVLVDAQDKTITPKKIEPIWSDDRYVIVRNDDIDENMLLATTHLVYAPQGTKVEIIPDVVPNADPAAAVAKSAPESENESVAN